MSLLARINTALVGCLAICALAAGIVCHAVLEASAREEVLATAELMMDSAVAARSYTADEIVPLLSDRLKSEFLPQSVPFYAATQNFLKIREQHPQFTYKEATLNPTNPRDRATDWESDVIQRFRNDPAARELNGVRGTAMGPSLYLARPIRAETECLNCHGLASAAPRPLIARYGSDNGFGWQASEVVGAQIVSVPLARSAAKAAGSFRALMTTIVAALAAFLLAVNIVLYTLVVRPLRATARIAERLSVGDQAAPAFPAGGACEIAQLGVAFDRLRKSLDKALKLLER